MTPMVPPAHPRRSRRAHFAAVLAIAVAAGASVLGVSAATADPKPGSTGATGPAVPVTAPRAPTTQKAATTNRSPSSKASSKASSRASSKSKVSAASGIGQGAKGDKVVEVQTLLQNLKFDIGDTGGSFGDQTYHAVMAFQKVNGLSRTGRVSDATLAAMRTAVDPEPLLPSGGADRIEIDLEKQYLALYKGGTLDKLLSISSGSGKDFCVLDPETNKTACDKAVTPGGSFRIRSRIIGWRESKLGLLYNPLYFNGGIAIHGAPSVPGTPASHGCVRIPMISAEWFPDAVVNNTPVYVFGGENRPAPLNAKAPSDTAPAAGSASSTTVPLATLPGSALSVGTPTSVAPTTLPGTTASTVPGATTTTSPGAVPLPTTLGPGVTNPATTRPAATLSTTAPSTTTVTTTTTPTTIPGGARLLTPPA